MINPVNNNHVNSLNKPNENQTKQVKSKEGTPNSQPEYILEIGKPQEKLVTYSPKAEYKPNVDEMERLKNGADEALAPLRGMVEELLKQQGLKFKGGSESQEKKEIVIDENTRTEAERLISDGGEYSAESVSNRLVDFAKAVSGGDKSKLEELRAAINEGYRQAEKAFGGELPEISRETINLTMKKLDEWANGDE